MKPVKLKQLPLFAPSKSGRWNYKPKTVKKEDTNALTKAIVNYLNMSGFRVWRQNNNAVFDPKIKRFRKNSATKGIPDVIGYQKHTARFIAVEVKTGKDTLSLEQIEFLQNLERFGGIAIVARDFSMFLSQIQAIMDTMRSGQPEITAGNQVVKYLESPVESLSNLTGQGD